MDRSTFLKSPVFFLVLALILFLPTFLINLGDQPIIEDEAIRSLVAFEMLESGDYVTPTMGGDPYLRKPPLYNWLIAGSFALFGNYSEVYIRIPMVISLFFFGLTIFFFVKREMGVKMGVLNALIFITVGRILFYESLHGLIDIAFSWLTYLFFMLSWRLFKKEMFLLLFISAYLITAITWMMKGLPSLVFLGISLLVLFISQRRFKMLLNWRHFVGIFVFLAMVGGYYLIYFNLNEDVSPKELFLTLLGQSTRRTVVRFGWLVTVKHLFTFPLEMVYHFLPWSVLAVLLFVKGSLKKIRLHPFLRYNLLLLIFNIIVYWTSPEVHPRYLLMFLPLFFTLVSYIYLESRDKNSKLTLILEYIFGGLLIIACLAPYGAILQELTKEVDHILVKAILFSMLMIVVTMVYWKASRMRIFWLAIAMLMIRIGFDLIILPTRQMKSEEVLAKQAALELAEKTAGEPLYCYFNPEFEPHHYYNRNLVLFRYQYWLSVGRKEIVYATSEKIPGALYFSDEIHIKDMPVEKAGELFQPVSPKKRMPLFRFE